MKRAMWLLSVLSSLLLPATALADPDVFLHPKSAEELAKTLLARPAQEVSQTRVLRGRFLHRKHLSDIPAPLESGGEFLFVRDRGLYWHTQKPFDSVFVLTPDAMLQQDDGGKALKMDAKSQPAVRAAAAIFLALFAVDLKALDKDFRMFGQPVAGQEGAWVLGLRPKSAAINSIFTQAIVSGAAQVREVELQDAHGDRTVIRLLDARLLQRAPSAEELALFAL
jgi:outer membrane lipoprotein-sorting protein